LGPETCSLQGSTVGLYECIYNTDGQYGHINGRKIFWLAFWSIQSAWVAMFPGFVAYAMFGEKNTFLVICFILMAAFQNIL